MGERSAIEWTDHTINMWIGCTKISPGCDFCYAERDFGSGGRFDRVEWGAHGSRSLVTSWRVVLARIAKKAAVAGRRERVFVNSLSDWADNHGSITSGRRGEIFEAAKHYPHLDFLLLTKRPQNMARFLPDDWGDGYPNVWLGISAENQDEMERRAPILLSTPAARRWLSAEPMLGPMNLFKLREASGLTFNALSKKTGVSFRGQGLDWVVAGGESGAQARPIHPDWLRALRDQCDLANVPFFFKRWGEWGPDEGGENQATDPIWEGRTRAAAWNGATPLSAGEWVFAQSGYDLPTDAGVGEWVYRLGVKRNGRALDGRTHDAVPAARERMAA